MSTSSAPNNPWNSAKPYDYGSSWILSKEYAAIINERVTGDRSMHWLPWSISKYICVGDTETESVLILGSNEGWMEIAIRQAGFKGRIVASDIADRALERARKRVNDLGLDGIEHVKADLNVDQFPASSFDYIVAEGVLHHIENIDFCIKGLRSALKPGGRLIGMEFVGAFRFQFPEAQVKWINAALDAIPRRYRPMSAGGDPNTPRDEAARSTAYYVPMTIDEIVAMDPSEAVSGHLLLDAIKSNFKIEMSKNGGGGLIMNMSGHFPFEETNTNNECREWLKVMANTERVLYEQNIVPSDLVFFVAR